MYPFLGPLMKKSKDLRLRVEPELFNDFSKIAETMSIPVSQLVRHLMTQFIEQNSSGRQINLFSASSISIHQERSDSVSASSE